MRIRDPGWKKFVSGMEKEFGSGINFPDPQHCCVPGTTNFKTSHY